MSTLVLSIDQPYASLIMAGVKQFETRPAPPNGDMRPDGVRGLPGARVNRGDRLLIASTTRTIRDKVVLGDFEAWPADPPGKVHPNHDSERPQRLYVNGTGWSGLIGAGSWWPLPLGCILGSVEVTDAYPIVNQVHKRPRDPDLPWITAAAMVLRQHDARPELGDGYFDGVGVDIEDQRPLGDWSPGRWAWALADPVPTTARCPRCDGSGRHVDPDPGVAYRLCEPCSATGRCEPVPVVGKQGVWRWEGAVRP